MIKLNKDIKTVYNQSVAKGLINKRSNPNALAVRISAELLQLHSATREPSADVQGYTEREVAAGKVLLSAGMYLHHCGCDTEALIRAIREAGKVKRSDVDVRKFK